MAQRILSDLIFQAFHGGRPNAGVHPFHYETKTGVPLYHGDALRFEEWEFRVTTKLLSIVPKSEEEDDLADVARRKKELSAKVLEGLRDEALKVAMDLGTAQIADADGVEKLIAAMDVVSHHCESARRRFSSAKVRRSKGSCPGRLARP